MGMNLAGLWIAMYSAQTFVFIYFLVLLKLTNWEAQVSKAQLRINLDNKAHEKLLTQIA